MKIIKFIGILIFICCITYAQNDPLNCLSTPIGGWSLLRSKISYNELARRAGIEGAYNFEVTVDSIGKIIGIECYSYNWGSTLNSADSLFIPNVISAIKNIGWKPGYVVGKPKTSKILVPIIFFLKQNEEIISRELIVVDTTIRVYIGPGINTNTKIK